MTDIKQTLQERGSTYGDFEGQAEITQAMKNMFTYYANLRGKKLANDQKEALDMIASKIARILNGDPDYDDSWHDIAGYASLVANRLRRDQGLSDGTMDGEP